MARPLTDEECRILQAFQRQVERLRQSSIVQLEKVTFKYTTKVTFPSGELETALEGYDEVAFQAQLPLLRQFILQNDPVCFYRIHDIVMQCCDREDLLGWTKYARQKWLDTLRRLPFDEHRFFYNAKDTVDAAVEKLFYGYGGLFHVNINEPDEEASVKEVQEATLQNAFPYFWNCLNNLDSVIHIWLEEPNKPIPSLPEK